MNLNNKFPNIQFNKASCWKTIILLMIITLLIHPFAFNGSEVSADNGNTLENNKYRVEIGSKGEIHSLKLPGDMFDTEYFMNSSNSSFLNETELDLWAGQVMFVYKFPDEDESWKSSWTSKSQDIRSIEKNENEIIVTYDGEAEDEEGIRDFKVIEKYTLKDDYVHWTIEIVNTSDKKIVIGDLGLPLPFYEQWVSASGLEETYEERVLTKSYIGNDSSFISIGRPDGSGDSMILIPDDTTEAGFEYQDRWKSEEYPSGPESLWSNDDGRWIKGLNVYYIHSEQISKTNKGYLPNTNLTLEPGGEKTYGFKFVRVSGEEDLHEKLYNNGLIDVTVVPSMIVPTDTAAKFSLRTDKKINSVEAEFPEDTSLEFKNEDSEDHRIYEVSFKKLGQNNLTVYYGDGKKTVLQFYAIEPIGDALQSHSTFMIEKMQYDLPGDIRDKVFDDWMMHKKTLRNNFAGYWGWGDDWGFTKAQFLAEKNVQTPVIDEVVAVDEYLDTAIWNTLMKNNQDDYLVYNFLMEEPNDTPTYRGYAYPHVYNTYFSMYKIANLYPDLIEYKEDPETYLLRTYNIMKTLYEGPVAYNWGTGLMGELTTPEIIGALQDEGYYEEAGDLETKMEKKFESFKKQPYPFGSEYNYDNTGEESVYMLAKMYGDTEIMKQINSKTRFARGWMPSWYYYSVPVTITGENWWNGQYSASLAGYAMDDWVRNYSEQPEIEQRLNWAGKIANISHINSGQIDPDPENIGAISWTYQSEKGNHGALGLDGGPLLNGWRSMSGEAGLGLWGAIKTLSVDITNDPIFGLTGYGGEVTKKDGNYEVIPKDGVSQRINLISEGIGMELKRDKFSSAIISSNKDYLSFKLKNVTPGLDHDTDFNVTGLKYGSYDVIVDGEVAHRINSFSDEALVTIPVGENSEYEVELVEGDPYENEAPTVEIEAIDEVTLPDSFILRGNVSDDGLPDSNLEMNWELVEGPEEANAEFINPNSSVTSVTVSKDGNYVFKLTATDGDLSSNDTVNVTVKPAPPLPEVIADYKFNENSGELIIDSSGNGMNGKAHGDFDWNKSMFENSLQLNGVDGYASLPEGIMDRVEDITIATWVKADSNENYQKIFDFGTGTQANMWLSHRAGGENLTFSITTDGNAAGAEQQISGPSIPLNQWKHVAVTLSGNVGILYVDGREVGRNEKMTLKPADLGKTINNYIGRSQYPDPYFDGEIDDFIIYSKALNANEIEEMATLPLDQIESVDEVEITSSLNQELSLPSLVSVNLSGGSSLNLPVIWEEYDPSLIEKEGTFTVEGTIVGTEIKTKANITVLIQIAPYPNLISRYNFDNPGEDPKQVIDSSENSHHGNIKGELEWEEDGYTNGSLKFSGDSGNYIDLGTNEELLPSDITVSYWIKRTKEWSEENVLMWFKPEGNYGGDGLFITYHGSSSVVMIDGTDSFFVDQHPNDFLPIDEWTNVVITFDSETKETAIYKNGEKQKTKTEGSPSSITSNDDVKKIGVSGYGDGAQLQASLDDFRIYDGAMTSKQVKSLYNGKDIISVDQIEVTTQEGKEPEMPETVFVNFENDSTGDVLVLWEDIDPSLYEKTGEFLITGILEGTNLVAEANVIVTEAQETIESVKVIPENNKLKPGESTFIKVIGVMSDGSEVDLEEVEVDFTSDQPEFVIFVDQKVMLSERIRNVNTIHVNANVTINDTTLLSASTEIEVEYIRDVVELETVIEKAKSLLEKAAIGTGSGQYPQKSADNLQKSVEEAESVLSDNTVGQAVIDEAINILNKAIKDFKGSEIPSEPVIETNDLSEIIEEAKSLLEKSIIGTGSGEYPQKSADRLKKAVEEAESVLLDDAVGQAVIDDTIKMLNEAIKDFKGSEIPSEPVIETNDLSEIIEEAKSLLEKSVIGTSSGEYPQKSADNLAKVIEKAESILSDNTVDQDKIDKTIKLMEKAIANFKNTINIVEENSDKDVNNEGKQIPQTATQIFNWLLLGFGIIFLGVILFVLNKKYNKNY